MNLSHVDAKLEAAKKYLKENNYRVLRFYVDIYSMADKNMSSQIDSTNKQTNKQKMFVSKKIKMDRQ